MPTYTIKSPDGRTFKVTAPEGTTKEQALARVQAHAKAVPRKTSEPQETTWQDRVGGLAGNYLEGILPGASGFARGIREAGINAIQAPFSDEVDFEPIKSYNKGKRFQEQRNKRAQAADPVTNGVAQAFGMVGGMTLPASKIAGGASMGTKVAKTAKDAAIYSAASGVMSSDAEDLTGKLEDGLSSGLVGATIGAGMPFAGKAIATATRPLQPVASRMAGKGAKALSKLPIAPPKFRKALAAEGEQLTRDPARATANLQAGKDMTDAVNPATGNPFTLDEVVDEVQRRHDIGVPAVAADVHESARRAYGAAAGAPGPATSAVRRAIDRRQEESTARMVDHIGETLGPTTNVDAQAEQLTKSAKEASRPLYAVSDATPIPFTEDLQELLQRPSARDAMQVAGREILDKGEKPFAFGLTQDAEGVFRPTEKPTMPLYDRMKTVLDKTVFAGGKPMAPPEVTRASEGAASIRSRLLDIMDGADDAPGLNPAWKPARDAYGGPVQSRQALELGEDMAKDGGEDIANRVGSLTPGQTEFFRLGHRSGLAGEKGVKKVGDYGNVATHVAGSLKKREGLRAAHGDKAQGLLERSAAEHEAHQTWKAVRGNSSTSDRLAAIDEQEKQIEAAASGLLQGLAGNPGGGLATVAKSLWSGNRKGAETKGRIAEVLTLQDPEALKEAVREILKEQARQTQTDARASALNQRVSRLFGEVLGTNLIDPIGSPETSE